MARTTPEPLSEQAALLHDLGRLSPFPLLILSRTLSFLEKKTEEALAQIDPFKNLRALLLSLFSPSHPLPPRFPPLPQLCTDVPCLPCSRWHRRRRGQGAGEPRRADKDPEGAGDPEEAARRYREGRRGELVRGGSSCFPSRSSITHDETDKDSTPIAQVMPTSKGYKCTEPRPPSVPPAAYPSVDPLTSFDDPSSTSSSSSASASPTLAELLAEFDPQPYVPFYGHGGERKSEGETYEEAQERTRKLRESRTSEARSEFDFMT